MGNCSGSFFLTKSLKELLVSKNYKAETWEMLKLCARRNVWKRIQCNKMLLLVILNLVMFQFRVILIGIEILAFSSLESGLSLNEQILDSLYFILSNYSGSKFSCCPLNRNYWFSWLYKFKILLSYSSSSYSYSSSSSSTCNYIIFFLHHILQPLQAALSCCTLNTYLNRWSRHYWRWLIEYYKIFFHSIAYSKEKKIFRELSQARK